MITKSLNEDYDYLAPNGSEIRKLSENKYGGIAHCTLPIGKDSTCVKHKTVEEIWYILEGKGKIWRKNSQQEKLEDLVPGISLTIPVDTSFQFCNTGDSELKIAIVTMPPWPEADEAIFMKGIW